MSKIGYIRVSTEHQETARQQEIMCDYQVDRIFSEKLSVSTQNASQFAKDRPQISAMLDYVREGEDKRASCEVSEQVCAGRY